MGQASTLTAVFALNDKYSLSMRKIMQSTDNFESKMKKAERATENFSKRTANLKSQADTGGVGINNLVTKISGLVSVAYIAKKGFDSMFAAINTSTLQKVQETTFQALLNSDKIGSQLYSYVGQYAKTSALGREDLAKGVTTFLTATRDIGQIEQLMKMTERLYAKDPTQGAEGAVFALKEALSGDTISLRNRYGITGLSGEDLRGGDTTSKLEQIDSALNKFGATQAVVDKNFYSLSTQTNLFASNLKTALGEAATPVMENLAQVVSRLNENLEAGKYQPFINLMVNGMEMIGNGIAFVADNATWLIPVVGGVVTGIIAYNVATSVAAVVTMGLTGNWVGLAAMAVGVGVAVAGMTLAMEDAKNVADGSANFKVTSDLAKNLATTPLATEITNTSPIAVKGEVDIEKENLQFLMDMAGQKFFAQYSHNTVIPQSQVNISTTIDVNPEEIVRCVNENLVQSTELVADGRY